MGGSERSAGFIIYWRDRTQAGGAEPQFLLLDYGRHWDFAKGHVEAGEDDLAAARRELREETGIADIVVCGGFREEILYFFRHKKRGLIRKTVVFFLAETPSREVVLSHEHAGYAFLPLADAIAKVTFPTARRVLLAAHEHLIRTGMATACPTEPSRRPPA